MARFLGLLLVVLIMPAAYGGEGALHRQIEAIQAEHQKALALSLNYSTKGRQAHKQVAKKLAAMYSLEGVNQGVLAYNIGNSWFHAGYYGESMLWYRRAEDLGYESAELKSNIAQVRSERLDELPELFAPNALILLRKGVGSPYFVLVCSVIYLLFWWQLWQFLRKKHNHGRLMATVFLVVFAVVGLAFRFNFNPPQSDGVITAQTITARKGPNLLFAPATTSPLNQGTEFIVLEKRNSWLKVLLSNEMTLWLPERAIGLVKG